LTPETLELVVIDEVDRIRAFICDMASIMAENIRRFERRIDEQVGLPQVQCTVVKVYSEL